MTYRIHTVPDDPQSDAAFVVTLTLEEAAREGDSIGWEIRQADFEQPGDPNSAWTGAFPTVWSEDGLWWIQHADPDNPTEAEFTEPPWFAGAATAKGATQADLDFVMAGAPYVPGSGGPPHPTTGALDYSFTLAGEATPLKEGEEEPVEVEPTRTVPTEG